ncbi:Cytochrome c1, heme protein, mitochondrial [Trichinella pseudospiralis]|uniref:Cytochrome c1, heme protein, mitochondrial n=1 Tax=Trichinella pseudospiralis TaxID=6337 RepID=A0A0V0XGE1_TRIPS|nr:Cytochrome c1, heme protein, mitochondrial [Trichinella pseudospiralis]
MVAMFNAFKGCSRLDLTYKRLLQISPSRLFGSFAAGQNKSSLPTIAIGVASAMGIGLLYTLNHVAEASFLHLHLPHLDWPHRGILKTYDAASIRRGYQVYKQVCAACHSMKQISYRHFVNVFMTEEEAKREASEVNILFLVVIEVEDGPGDDGKMYMRPGKLIDYLPQPYPNEVAARLANNGALPPDLSMITLARHGGEDYLFMLLTGYMDPPAGFPVESYQAYNPYFPNGAAIAMTQQLFDDMLEYEDGTPATQSQMAKDVACFLKWASEPEHDIRKRWAFKLLVMIPPIAAIIYYWKRHQWTYMKSRKFVFRSPRKPSAD